MSKIKKGRQYGVPLGVSRDLIWHNNGVITQKRDPDHRMVFTMSDFLDELFVSLRELADSHVELMVIESKRRSRQVAGLGERRSYINIVMEPWIMKSERAVY